MRVLTITSELHPYILGGLGTHVTNLVLALKKNELTDVTAATFKYPKTVLSKEDIDMSPIEIIEGIPLFDTNELASFYSINQNNFDLISKVLKSTQKFDLIHVHDFLCAHAGIVLKDILGIPLVATLHDTLIGRVGTYEKLDDNGKYFCGLQKALADNAEQVICCSYSMQQEIKNFYQIKPEKINIVYNGVNSSLKVDKEHDDTKNNKKVTVIFVGRLSKEKGIEELLKAIEILRKKKVEVYLNIVGDHSKPYGVKLERKVKSNSLLKDSVSFKGFMSGEELMNLVSDNDIAVVPSHYEPFGIVALEAASYGLPIIASNVGGLKEIIDTLKMGLLVPSKDSIKLAKSIEILANDPELRGRIGRNNKEVSIKKFNWNNIAEETFAVYRHAILGEQCCQQEKIRNYDGL